MVYNGSGFTLEPFVMKLSWKPFLVSVFCGLSVMTPLKASTITKSHAMNVMQGPCSDFVMVHDLLKTPGIYDGIYLGMSYEAVLNTGIHLYPTKEPDEYATKPMTSVDAFPKLTIRIKDNHVSKIFLYTNNESLAERVSIHALHQIGDSFADMQAKDFPNVTLADKTDDMWLYSVEKDGIDVTVDADREKKKFGILMKYEDS